MFVLVGKKRGGSSLGGKSNIGGKHGISGVTRKGQQNQVPQLVGKVDTLRNLQEVKFDNEHTKQK